ncbi:hypothetical protein ACFWIJ_02100 [Streptomyces sp. NPDC127079]|uniref:hypothetical protein n=1 Tax=Streptomyces sp. NPDC127079 TaxID=3347132 RepID=UPI0036503B50
MPSSKDVRDLVAARRAGRRPLGVPQVDPADVVQDEPTLEAGPAPQQSSVEEGASAPEEAIIVPQGEGIGEPKNENTPAVPVIDKSQTPEPFSTYAFKERKKQLKMESAATGNDIWEIIEAALDDYFSPRNAKKRQRKQQ